LDGNRFGFVSGVNSVSSNAFLFEGVKMKLLVVLMAAEVSLTSSACLLPLVATLQVAPVATAPSGPWMYRRIFMNKASLMKTEYFGNSGTILTYSNEDGIEMNFVTKIEVSASGMIALKAKLKAASLASTEVPLTTSEDYVIEIGGMDPVSGKKFVLDRFSSYGARYRNPSAETNALLSFFSRISGI
jgi:hypothetical protein